MRVELVIAAAACLLALRLGRQSSRSATAAAPGRTLAPAPVAAVPDSAILQFLFDKRLSLFNARRDHEWRVTFGTMVLIGGVDTGLLTMNIRLDAAGIGIWWATLLLLFLTVTAYQFGVQTRNRVDRIAMDAIYMRLCDIDAVTPDSAIRVGVDRASPLIASIRTDIFQRTFLWAFWCQTVVLCAGCILSGALPFVLNGAFRLPALKASAVGASAAAAAPASPPGASGARTN